MADRQLAGTDPDAYRFVQQLAQEVKEPVPSGFAVQRDDQLASIR